MLITKTGLGQEELTNATSGHLNYLAVIWCIEFYFPDAWVINKNTGAHTNFLRYL